MAPRRTTLISLPPPTSRISRRPMPRSVRPPHPAHSRHPLASLWTPPLFPQKSYFVDMWILDFHVVWEEIWNFCFSPPKSPRKYWRKGPPGSCPSPDIPHLRKSLLGGQVEDRAGESDCRMRTRLVTMDVQLKFLLVVRLKWNVVRIGSHHYAKMLSGCCLYHGAKLE